MALVHERRDVYRKRRFRYERLRLGRLQQAFRICLPSDCGGVAVHLLQRLFDRQVLLRSEAATRQSDLDSRASREWIYLMASCGISVRSLRAHRSAGIARRVEQRHLGWMEKSNCSDKFWTEPPLARLHRTYQRSVDRR